MFSLKRASNLNSALNNFRISTGRNVSSFDKREVKQISKRSWSKIALVSIGLPGSLFFAYYQLALDNQEKRRIRVHIESVGRAIRSVKVGLQIVTDYKWNLYGLTKEDDGYAKIIKGCHSRSAEVLVKTCIANGGMYVKLGQGLSMMNHILPKEFYLTLRKLQNEALRSEGNDIDNLFLEEFNQLPKDMFKEFEYKPIAAASLAQVHKAVTNEGEEVAVKLQYIDLQDRFKGDFATCKFILKMVGVFYPDFNFEWVLDEMRGTLTKEMDFVNEADNAKRCYKELKHLKFLHVPKVYDAITTKRILTMEFIDGFTLGDVDGIKKSGLKLKDIDEKLARIFGEQIFNSGFVHADPHHGNIFVRKQKGSKNQAEIVLIDHGLYCFINEEDRKNLCNLWYNIILKDEEQIRQYASKLNVTDYSRFSDMLTMEPPLSRKQGGLFFKKKLTDHDILLMRQAIGNTFDKIQIILKQVPNYMLLIFRNLNTVRSIIHDHGNLVDRHTIMARIAVYGAHSKDMSTDWKTSIRAWYDLKRFDLILVLDRLTRWTYGQVFKLLVRFNQINDEIVQDLKQIEEKLTHKLG